MPTPSYREQTVISSWADARLERDAKDMARQLLHTVQHVHELLVITDEVDSAYAELRRMVTEAGELTAYVAALAGRRHGVSDR